jgi:hypothetical protein
MRAHAAAVAAADELGPSARAAEALAGFVDVLDGRARPGLERVERVVDEGERSGPAAPGEQGLLVRILVEACAVAGDARAGLVATDRAARTGNGAQPWGEVIARLRAEFLRAAERSEERRGNGTASTMPPIPHDDLPHPHPTP